MFRPIEKSRDAKNNVSKRLSVKKRKNSRKREKGIKKEGERGWCVDVNSRGARARSSTRGEKLRGSAMLLPSLFLSLSLPPHARPTASPFRANEWN